MYIYTCICIYTYAYFSHVNTSSTLFCLTVPKINAMQCFAIDIVLPLTKMIQVIWYAEDLFRPFSL